MHSCQSHAESQPRVHSCAFVSDFPLKDNLSVKQCGWHADASQTEAVNKARASTVYVLLSSIFAIVPFLCACLLFIPQHNTSVKQSDASSCEHQRKAFMKWLSVKFNEISWINGCFFVLHLYSTTIKLCNSRITWNRSSSHKRLILGVIPHSSPLTP